MANEQTSSTLKERLASLAMDLIYPDGENASLESSLFEAHRIQGRVVWALGDGSKDGEDIYAQIVRKVCSALMFDNAALLLSSQTEDRHFLTAYINLPPELLQIITRSGNWLGLSEHVQSMRPGLLRLHEGPATGPYRTAMALFGFKSLGMIPFWASPNKAALLLLPLKEKLTEEQEGEMLDAFTLAQRHIQMAMDHLTLQIRDAQRSARLLAIKEGLRRLASTSHPIELLQTTCEQIRRIFECTVAWIGLIETDLEGRLQIEPFIISGASARLLAAYDPALFENTEGLFHSALNSNEITQRETSAESLLDAEAHREAEDDPDHPLHRVVAPDALESTMLVPLVSASECLGLMVMHRDSPFKLWDEDRDVLRIFTDQAALAIKTSRLLREGEARAARLEASEGLYRSFVQQLSDGIFRLDQDGRVVELNDCAADLFGVTREEVFGRPLMERFTASDEKQLALALEQALGGASEELSLKVQRDDDRQVVAVARIGPLIAGDEVVGLIGVARDDTERVAMQSKLLVREKLASVGMLAAGVAHEINNPLAFIISNVTTLTEDLEAERDGLGDYFEASERLEMLRECLDGTERIRDIVANLRQFSQHSSHEEFYATDLNPLIQSTAWMVHPEARYSGRINLELAEVPRIHCSPGRIAQLLVQLMLNAIQALPSGELEGQTITVRTRPEAEVGVVLEIEDSGAGIPREVLPLIFEPFYSTKGPENGTGLGLVMCQEVVERHRGQMHIQTEEGVGTTISVHLPLNPERAAARKPSLILQYGAEILPE